LSLIRINPSDYKNIVFLTGAGISAASGIQTYRGSQGLWNDGDLYRLSQGSTLRSQPLETWRFFSRLRALAAKVDPNPAHRFLAGLEAKLQSDQSLTVVTQNIDGLHTKAGSLRVIEFHGAVRRTRCFDDTCSGLPFEETVLHETAVPVCPVCGSIQRPDVVLFGEAIPPSASGGALKALAKCDLFVAVGTSGSVWPAAQFVQGAFKRGARTVFLNLTPLEQGAPFFTEQYLGPAEATLPALFGSGLEPEELQGTD
jgi:NAD-dependent deacetylase